ncbi:type IX secretion system outer membrane channel protein PorV [Aequorivita todarodis]|uniref:type IX secretion system outer membrane channel protein PorV n=1 Tax=Aequorivita todarodis TaxID=2036821 RepID=UPI002350DF22|nr:type IX secretion system outer membrane channel protein PorV [Aequorivita todarodis]MDC7999640.1 type IX secretion system outer membrane channel protein PorV [Aequorivita todarodis]
MKKLLIPILIGFVAFQAHSQETIIVPNSDDSRVITTGVPFILIGADPRSGGMGDIGVTTSADAFSQQWNPAKYAFSLSKQGVGVTYTPYLSKLVNDIFLGNLTYYNRLNERSAVAASFRYFSNGDIELRETAEQEPLLVKPNELMFDVSYSLRLSERFSMAVAGRYIRSDLKLQSDPRSDATAANTFAVDVAGYYQSEEIPYNDFDGRWRMGFNISNIGPKLKYDEVGSESFLPTNLALGGGFDFILDEYNKIGVSAEVNKLLVPTPPIRGTEFIDENGNGTYENGIDTKITDQAIYEGKENDVTFIKGMFQSFGDAPGGFSEELKEFTWALGAEYWYQDVFAFRGGYFNESDDKGGRKFATIGAGFRYTAINIDISYLFSTSKLANSPLDGTLRFGLTFNFGDTYDEY